MWTFFKNKKILFRILVEEKFECKHNKNSQCNRILGHGFCHCFGNISRNAIAHQFLFKWEKIYRNWQKPRTHWPQKGISISQTMISKQIWRDKQHYNQRNHRERESNTEEECWNRSKFQCSCPRNIFFEKFFDILDE